MRLNCGDRVAAAEWWLSVMTARLDVQIGYGAMDLERLLCFGWLRCGFRRDEAARVPIAGRVLPTYILELNLA